jgi:hypothetical protein
MRQSKYSAWTPSNPMSWQPSYFCCSESHIATWHLSYLTLPNIPLYIDFYPDMMMGFIKIYQSFWWSHPCVRVGRISKWELVAWHARKSHIGCSDTSPCLWNSIMLYKIKQWPENWQVKLSLGKLMKSEAVILKMNVMSYYVKVMMITIS